MVKSKRSSSKSPQSQPLLSQQELFFLIGSVLNLAKVGGRREAEQVLGVSVGDPQGLEYVHSKRVFQSRAVGRLITKLGQISAHQPR
jgi:hypothetical protein